MDKLVVDLRDRQTVALVASDGSLIPLTISHPAHLRLLVRLAMCPTGSPSTSIATSVLLEDGAAATSPAQRRDWLRGALRQWQATGPVPIDLHRERLIVDRARIQVHLPKDGRWANRDQTLGSNMFGRSMVFESFFAAAVERERRGGRLLMEAGHNIPMQTEGLVILVPRFDTEGLSRSQRALVRDFRAELVEALRYDPTFHVYAGFDRPPYEGSLEAVYTLRITCRPVAQNIDLSIELHDGIGRERPLSRSMVLYPGGKGHSRFSPALVLAGRIGLALQGARISDCVMAPGLLDLWYRCEERINAFWGLDWDAIQVDLKDVCRQAPEFVRAVTSLVNVMNSVHIARHGEWRDHVRSQEAFELSNDAIRRQPRFARNHLAHAHSCMMNGLHADAIRHFYVAHDLNPIDVRTLISSACGLAVSGEVEAGLELMANALEFVPEPTPSQEHYFGLIHLLNGDLPSAVQHFALAANKFPISAAFLAAAYGLMGDEEQAMAAWKRAVEIARERWSRPRRPSEAEIAAWYLHLVPFAHERDWAKFRDGLRIAGAPVYHCRFQQW